MTLQQLKYVVTVAETKSISEGAKYLYVSQPSITNAIKALESELGITIFGRTNKGISITVDGRIFLGYARQVLEQSALLEEKYLNGKHQKQHFAISTQHYTFAVNAFVEMIKQYGEKEYDFTIRETRTYEIIEDVKLLRSEIGVLYLNSFNEQVIMSILEDSELQFTELYRVTPHVFITSSHPLASKRKIALEDLIPYPHLSFEQGEHNSFYFSEEILSTLDYKRTIKVSDRATLFNLVIGLFGYTISTGIISGDLNGWDIIAKPLDTEDCIRIGIITRKNFIMSRLGEIYVDTLRRFFARGV